MGWVARRGRMGSGMGGGVSPPLGSFAQATETVRQWCLSLDTAYSCAQGTRDAAILAPGPATTLRNTHPGRLGYSRPASMHKERRYGPGIKSCFSVILSGMKRGG